MKPMGLNSTRFITYRDIEVEGIDLIEDAWGFNSDYYDVISVLRQLKVVPEKKLINNLIEKIRDRG